MLQNPLVSPLHLALVSVPNSGGAQASQKYHDASKLQKNMGNYQGRFLKMFLA